MQTNIQTMDKGYFEELLTKFEFDKLEEELLKVSFGNMEDMLNQLAYNSVTDQNNFTGLYFPADNDSKK